MPASIRTAAASKRQIIDKILQLLPGGVESGGALGDRGREAGDRGFALAELVERLLVERGVVIDRGEVGAQSLFVLDHLLPLLPQPGEVGGLRRQRLAAAGEV